MAAPSHSIHDAIDTFLLSLSQIPNPTTPHNPALSLKLILITLSTLLFILLFSYQIHRASWIPQHGHDETRRRDWEWQNLNLRVDLREWWGIICVSSSTLIIAIYYLTSLSTPACSSGSGLELCIETGTGTAGQIGILGGMVVVVGWGSWMLLDLDSWHQREMHRWIDAKLRALWRGEVRVEGTFRVLQWVLEDSAEWVLWVWVSQFSKGERVVEGAVFGVEAVDEVESEGEGETGGESGYESGYESEEMVLLNQE